MASRLGFWAHQVFIALDQLANVLISVGNDDGFADETLSARSWRKGSKRDARTRWKVALRVIDALFYWQDAIIRHQTGAWPAQRHCQRAYDSERARLGLPPEYRQ